MACSIPFQFNSTSEECSLTRKSSKPVLFSHENGNCISTLVLKLTKPVHKITAIIYKNANSAFISMTLTTQKDSDEKTKQERLVSYTILPETQQFSLDQFKANSVAALTKIKTFKPNNKYIDTSETYTTLNVHVHGFIDLTEPHQLGLAWIELFGIVAKSS
jgi:hypothetical protein